jgi:ribonuclease HI
LRSGFFTTIEEVEDAYQTHKIKPNICTKKIEKNYKTYKSESNLKTKNNYSSDENDEGFYDLHDETPLNYFPFLKQKIPCKTKFAPNHKKVPTQNVTPKQTPALNPGLLFTIPSSQNLSTSTNNVSKLHVGPSPRLSQMRWPPGVPCKKSDNFENDQDAENSPTNQTQNVQLPDNTNINYENENNRSPTEHENNSNNPAEDQNPDSPTIDGDDIDSGPQEKEQTIIQWNCNGFYNHYEEIKMLISYENPIVLCLQETHFKAIDSPTLRGFTIYHESELNRAIHGVAICIKNEISSQQIQLNTHLKAVAVRIHAPKEMTICSIYIPPRTAPTEKDYEQLIDQLPTPFLLAGDFNARSPIWSEDNSCTKGKIIEKLLSKFDLAVLNTGESTHFSTAYGSYSAIDLSIVTPTLISNLKWHVYADLCSSDHFPIVMTFLTNQFTKKKRKRWRIKLADWEKFQETIDDSIFEKRPTNIQELTKILQCAALKCIPKTGDKMKRPPVPWWSAEIKNWIRKRRKAERKYKKTRKEEDLAEFRKLRAKVKYLIKKAKREKWREYVDTITVQTNPTNMWNKIGKISGKRRSTGISAMSNGTNITCDPYEIANILAEHFEIVSSTQNYTTEFLKIKEREEQTPIDILDEDNEPYNLPFTSDELEDALHSCKGSSPGTDEIHYQMLINLTTMAKKNLLEIYNSIWISGVFPEEWTEALIVPIVKPGKDPKMPNSYRPISLTSCVCKLMEKMANKRLTWFLETNGHISENQFGFRKNRSTADCTLILESEIQKAFAEKQHVVAVSCDLEKAYDTAWRHGILKNLSEMTLKGKLMLFLQNFMNNRTFRVIVGNTMSKKCTQANGVVQGAVISVNLFLVAINSITRCVEAPVKIVGFADDWTLYLRDHDVKFIQETMQKTLDNLSTWSTQNGFRFSPEKTVIMHFHRRRPRNVPVIRPRLQLNGQNLIIVETHKILGLKFDEKLKWNCHVEYIKEKVNKRLNLIKALSGLQWGSDQDILLRIYQTMVLSVIEYGVTTYSSARYSILKKLDPLHNQGIRLALGAFKSSRIENLLCEAGMTSLEQRRKLLSTETAVKITSNTKNPLKNMILNSTDYHTFIGPRTTKPFYIRAQDSSATLDINLAEVWENSLQQQAPWIKGRFSFDYSMQKFDKNNNQQIIRAEFLKLQQNCYQHLVSIFTDGSKMADKTGCAVITPDQEIKIRLADHTTVYTAELYAILQAVEWSTNRDDQVDVAVYTDSLSSVQALENMYVANHPLLRRIKDKLNDQSRKNLVTLVWTPGHCGIQGNEQADAAAKQALDQEEYPNIKIPAKDLISKARQNSKKLWQQIWESSNSPMLTIKKSTERWKPARNLTRRDQVVLTRTRIGHTRLTHSYHMEHKERPTCQTCDVAVTIRHLLFECPVYDDSRRTYNIRESSLGNDERGNLNIINFLKHNQIYDEI